MESSFNNSFIAHFIAILLLPVNAIGVIPYFLIKNYQYQQITSIHLDFGIWNYILAICLASIGFILFISSIIFFIRIGKGTLAPWTPTSQLVVSGPYAFVRNPMISGVVFILFAEAFFFMSPYVLVWAIVFFLISHFYFLLWEEKSLENKFGLAYTNYKSNVARWIPGIKPWTP